MGQVRDVILPAGLVTLVFTDIDSSTKLLHELGERYGELLAEHHRLLRQAWTTHGGVEVDTDGDAFFVAFASPRDAIRAVEEAAAANGGQVLLSGLVAAGPPPEQ